MADERIHFEIRPILSDGFAELLRRLIRAGQIRLLGPGHYWPADPARIRRMHTAYSRRLRARRRRRR